MPALLAIFASARSIGAAALKWLSTLDIRTILCIALAIATLFFHWRADHWKAVATTRQAEVVACNATRDSERAAMAQTVANYRAAAAQAAADDKANADRVIAQQKQISKEQSDEYQTRIAAARAERDRLRNAARPANPGGAAKPPVSSVSPPVTGPAQAPGEAGLSDDDKLTATEQAIQLDELIKWVKRQAGIDPNK